MRPMPAQLVGGPCHGDMVMIDGLVYRVALPISTSAWLTEDASPTMLTMAEGEYRARLRGGKVDRLPSGTIPYDYVGPEGPTWAAGVPR